MAEIETPEFRMAFISVLVEAYVRFNAAGRPEVEPEGVSRACAETFGENRFALDMFLDDYELTGSEGDFVASADIQSWVDFHKIDVSMTKLTTEFKKYAEINGIGGVQAKSKKIFGKLARGWVGLRLISEDLLESS